PVLAQTVQSSTQSPNVKKQEPQVSNAEPAEDALEEVPEGELAPAAIQLDLSKASPLIQELYAATRETKEEPILARLAQAKKLVENGADLKAVDSQGRTALHWAVFGSSYNTKPKIVVAYEEIADAMIGRGIEINREDVYQDTALDYLMYSPNYEMQTLLIENGATSGFLAASNRFFNQISGESVGNQTAVLSTSRKADLTPGGTLSVRLNVPVYSDRSRTGDPLEGTVTYPLCRNGEQIACKEGELVMAPGTRVNGTILFAQKAPDKYSQPRVVLDFSNIVYKNGERSPLYARVIDVDNARETVRNNEILGIIQPHAGKKASLAMAAVSIANPLAGYTLKGVQTIYGLSIRREVLFSAGTDTQVQILRPSLLKQKNSWAGWPRLPRTPEPEQLVQTAALRTNARNGTPSDLTNLMFLGTRNQLITAFGEAGWIEADDLGVGSSVKTMQATMRQSGYTSGPVSALLLQGRLPDLVFQKSLNTFAKRHHIRIWKLANTYNGREV